MRDPTSGERDDGALTGAGRLTIAAAALRFGVRPQRLRRAAAAGALPASRAGEGARMPWLLRSREVEQFLRRAWPARPRGTRAELQYYLRVSRAIPGWTRGAEAGALAQVSRALPADPVLVEIGSFLGCSTVLLAGARKVAGSGMVCCVDPFDASGEAFSAPIYQAVQDSLGTSLRQRFDENIRRAGLSEWVRVHQGLGTDVARTWTTPIDLLFLDGDQSYAGARPIYDAWARFLKPGGVLAIHNSGPRAYATDHDGLRRLAVTVLQSPPYGACRCIGSTTFAWKTPDHGES